MKDVLVRVLLLYKTGSSKGGRVWLEGRRARKDNRGKASYASSLPSLRMVMYFSHRSPVT